MNPNTLALASQNAPMSLSELQTIGRIFHAAKYFQDVQSEAQAIVKILAGQEMGFKSFESMTGIHIIKGKPAVGSHLIASRIKGSGKYDFRIKKHDATVCEIEFFEFTAGGKESLGIETFTIEMARKAGTQNLDKFAKNMLFARCISNGQKFHCPDVFGCPVYTPEELGAVVNEEGDVLSLPAEPKRAALPTPTWTEVPADSELSDIELRNWRIWLRENEPENPRYSEICAEFEKRKAARGTKAPAPKPPTFGDAVSEKVEAAKAENTPEELAVFDAPETIETGAVEGEVSEPVELLSDAQRRAIFAIGGRVFGKTEADAQIKEMVSKTFQKTGVSELSKHEATTLIDTLKARFDEQTPSAEAPNDPFAK